MVLVVGPSSITVESVPPLDSIAEETIRSKRDLLVQDHGATEFRQSIAAETAQPVYEYDPDLFPAAAAPVQAALEKMAQRLKAGALTRAERFEAFSREIPAPVNAATFELIESIEQPSDISSAIVQIFAPVLDKMVAANRRPLRPEHGLVVRNLAEGEMSQLVDPIGVLTLAQAERLMRAAASEVSYGSARIIRTWVQDTAIRLLKPNLMYNEALTRQLRESTIEAVEPVYVRIGSGEIVVRAGDRVTATVRERLSLLRDAALEHSIWRELMALAALVLGLIGLGGLYFRGSGGYWRGTARKICYLSLSSTAVTAIISLTLLYLGLALADALTLDPKNAAYLLPISLVTILVRALVNARISLLAGVSLALLFAYRVDGDLWLLTYYLAGILAAGVAMRWCHRRDHLLKVGLAAGVAQLLAIPVVTTLASPLPGGFDVEMIVPGALALCSGILAGLLAMLLLPILEHLFEEATNMRLVELSSADNPLLKDLAMRSPGTYYRSVLIANLAESAGEAIDANGPRCRAMALYHDLGKAVRPSYFTENQRGRNIHDRLEPELSARIMFAHIKDGIEIARRHRLGQTIVEAITQHQGTELLSEFYEKAIAEAARTGAPVDERDFRCPGPKPRSKEAGVLLLADSVEAATGNLKEPTAEQIRMRVDKVVEDKVAEGELNECALSIADLSRIKEAFCNVLGLSVFHNRIEYPPMPNPQANNQNDARKSLLGSVRSLARRSS